MERNRATNDDAEPDPNAPRRRGGRRPRLVENPETLIGGQTPPIPDFHAQEAVLRRIRDWAAGALEELQSLEAEEGIGYVDPVVATEDSPASFAVHVGRAHSLRWSLQLRASGGVSYWTILLTARPRPAGRWPAHSGPRGLSSFSREWVEHAVRVLYQNHLRTQDWKAFGRSARNSE
jgi:hypothetical protein